MSRRYPELVAWIVPFVVVFFAVQPSWSQNEPATFTAQSELVLVPAVVTDKSGNFVGNLSKDDFVVLEDGKPQTVRVFAEQLTTSARVQRTPTANGSFSNVLETGSTPKRLVIIALDLVNTPILLQGSARNELLQYLAKSLDPGEPTELVAIGRSGLVVLHDFTGDPALLVGALQRFSGTSLSLAEKQSASQGPPPGDALAAILRMLAHLENEDKASMEAFDRRTAILTTLEAMQQIAAAVAGIPGRKALLWLSAGFPFSISQTDAAPGLGTVLDPYQRTWRLLNQSQVAVYPIDIRALTNPKFHGVNEPGTKHLPWEPPGDDPYTDILMRDDKEQQEILTTLQNFADATGGRAFFDSNDLQRGFREAVRDNASYYMLGYYLDRHGKKPGWHKLQVRVHRNGVEVRARNTFLLTTSGNREVAKSDLGQALQAPVDFTGIPIQGSWTAVTGNGGSNKAGFELVMPANFAEIDESDNNHLHVEFVAEARRENGPPVRVGKTVDVHLDANGLEQIRNHGMTYRDAFKLPAGHYAVHFVVLDVLSAKTGSVIASLEVQ